MPLKVTTYVVNEDVVIVESHARSGEGLTKDIGAVESPISFEDEGTKPPPSKDRDLPS